MESLCEERGEQYVLFCCQLRVWNIREERKERERGRGGGEEEKEKERKTEERRRNF